MCPTGPSWQSFDYVSGKLCAPGTGAQLPVPVDERRGLENCRGLRCAASLAPARSNISAVLNRTRPSALVLNPFNQQVGTGAPVILSGTGNGGCRRCLLYPTCVPGADLDTSLQHQSVEREWPSFYTSAYNFAYPRHTNPPANRPRTVLRKCRSNTC